MKNNFLVAICFCCLTWPSWGQVSTPTVQEAFFGPDANKVLVAAHRAAHKEAPENSIAAIKKAIEYGVDIIEIDIRITKDGVPVIMHDESVARTTNGTGNISDHTLAELKEYFLKNQDGSLSEERIPTFEEALSAAKNKILIDLDLKLTEIERVVTAVEEAEMQEQVFFFDSDYEVLKHVQQLNPKLALMPRTYSMRYVKKAERLFSPLIFHIDDHFYTQKVTDHIDRLEARIWINALGNLDEQLSQTQNTQTLTDFLTNGANVIQTDEPQLIIRMLREKGLHH